ncbi:MAG: hypothetical protein CSA22_05875 [Deltaproteobacteria bacterium]|nr:MAG: hypothetical protein CSA22_05875 [Deltaproteobacteria bacterium]
MDNFTPEEIEEKKRAIYDAMGKRGQRQIDKKGYDKWDPFAEPKDPIEIRKDGTRRTSQQLMREFMQGYPHESYNNAFGRGVVDMALGIINHDDKIRGMYQFAIWYRDLLEKEGKPVDLPEA